MPDVSKSVFDAVNSKLSNVIEDLNEIIKQNLNANFADKDLQLRSMVDNVANHLNVNNSDVWNLIKNFDEVKKFKKDNQIADYNFDNLTSHYEIPQSAIPSATDFVNLGTSSEPEFDFEYVRSDPLSPDLFPKNFK